MNEVATAHIPETETTSLRSPLIRLTTPTAPLNGPSSTLTLLPFRNCGLVIVSGIYSCPLMFTTIRKLSISASEMVAIPVRAESR